METGTIADRLVEHLAVFLGPHTARTAVKTFAERKLNLSPEDLTPADLPAMMDALLPMLRTLLGRQAAESLADRIRAEGKP